MMAVTLTLIFVLSLAGSLTLIRCSNVSQSSVPLDEKNGIPQLKTLSGTRDSSGSVFFRDVTVVDGRYFATQTGSAKLYILDKSRGKWQPQTGFPETGWPLGWISFVDEKRGFVSGNGGTLLKTTDAGKSWQVVTPFTSRNLGKMVFPSASNAYIVGESAVISETNGVTYGLTVFKSEDGGSGWRIVYSNDDIGAAVFDVAAPSADICILALGGGTMLRTRDGGQSWQNLQSLENVSSIAFAPTGVGWLVSAKGSFMRSDDGGMTWHKSASNRFDGCEWSSLDIDESGFGAVVSTDGCFAYTTDGQTWIKADPLVPDRLQQVIANKRGIIALGENNIYEIVR